MQKGGCDSFAFPYAFLNEFVEFILGAALLRIFSRHETLKRRWPIFSLDIGNYSHAAFLVHMPVLVAVQSGLDEMTWKETSAGLITADVSMIGIGTFWMVGCLPREAVNIVGCGGFL
jgi:peptidoglycan/LPS O-acetylase OafA/YrhL